ncbi:type II toxin-antitoxin system RelE/ParE family toxin [Proteus mirabilis]|uniref:type II toxin-antitoxin system RelE/ParE family toxin n=1 Tax=Proteus mirabilis TaxID=584 RepID=UPI000D5266C4|nr:type II toxin-antitoxin system RelE/ParE family toxin [Proteus mirabilis]AWF40584.1 plasmid stabilization system family protein [Proteus mirabilis]HBC7457647.1 type II toxin-antitoxin system RelE/ParE family toxin [Proteus mirabilis]HCT7981703.1 type II toxin-antitoxin system RelE/ParE family toxin [Proteus mirabilis]HEI8494214.1 type II toxin-antitoxin system RelE/ParE family toxin [Proteus mirabilis]HEJ0115929.1 type II toxin-antitoxin system RelE/ParE family toxin [Proteus mirabilis]
MYKLSKLAEEDIYQIARYTIQQFGVTQAKKYHNDLKQTFELLAKAPWIGRECNWVCNGMRRFEFEKHSIYYLPKNDTLFITRLIHHSIDVDFVDFPK